MDGRASVCGDCYSVTACKVCLFECALVIVYVIVYDECAGAYGNSDGCERVC